MPNAVPNYLRTGSGGSIFAVFPGGVEIPTVDQSVGIAPIRPGVGVIWKQSADGALLAEMTTTAWHRPGVGTPRTVEWDLSVSTDPANATAPAASGGLSILLQDGTPRSAQVLASAQSDATNNTTGRTVKIIDANGNSDFVRVASGAGMLANGGPFTWSFSGGASGMVIPHGLGRVPLFAFAVAEVGTGFVIGYGAFSYNSTNFTAAAKESTGALSGGIPGHWFAIG